MNTELLYELYEITEKNDAPDLATVGMPMLREKHPEITHEEAKETVSYTHLYHAGTGKVQIVPETKTVTPTKSEQTVEATEGKVLFSVTVGAIPEEFVDTDVYKRQLLDQAERGRVTRVDFGLISVFTSSIVGR